MKKARKASGSVRTGASRSSTSPTSRSCSCTTCITREPSAAFALSRLTQSSANATPIGVFRDVERPVYDDLMSQQLDAAREKQEGDIAALLHSGDTWTL